jgi:hypothetical protein
VLLNPPPTLKCLGCDENPSNYSYEKEVEQTKVLLIAKLISLQYKILSAVSSLGNYIRFNTFGV